MILKSICFYSALNKYLAAASLFAFSVGKGYSQLCSGSLGDPVVNITFGNATTSAGYGATNAYFWSPTSCPNDGFYAVTNSTSGCFGTWHTVSSDHTGDGGAFLIINASYLADDFFNFRVSNLCPATTYEFASWIMNVMKPSGIHPNILFRIETPGGTVLKQYSSGDIPYLNSPAWKQYGFFFTTPPGISEVVLRMTNNAPGGWGNDFAIDDITFRPCGPKIDAVVEGIGSYAKICAGKDTTYNLTAQVSAGFTDPVFQWQKSADSGKTWQDIAGARQLSLNHSARTTGRYTYRMAVSEKTGSSAASCRVASRPVVIEAKAAPLVNAGPDRTLFPGDTIFLKGILTGEAKSINWYPPLFIENEQTLNPGVFPPSNQAYALFAESENGCKAIDSMKVWIASGLYIPTAFTPNDDGRNDRWRIPGLDPSQGAVIAVYNRYGQVLYEKAGGWVDWDGTYRGKAQPSGTYSYRLIFSNGRAPMWGTIQLIR